MIDSPNFKVTRDGTIYAAAGEIGGWNIGENELSGWFTQNNKTYNIGIGSPRQFGHWYLGTEYACIWAGGTRNTNGSLNVGDSDFIVTYDGTLIANKGYIGGCEIVDGRLKIGDANIGKKLTADSIDATNLKVNAVNITGTLTAGQIDATSLKVSAVNITGTLTADQIDTTTFGSKSISCLAIDAGNSIIGDVKFEFGNIKSNYSNKAVHIDGVSVSALYSTQQSIIKALSSIGINVYDF
jgi:hypothetical protein